MSETQKGGRMPGNFRAANIAESLAVQMLRPFAAIAEVDREEDFGIDLVGTLLRKSGKSLIAEDSFVVQIKTHTAAVFEFANDGVRWLRQLTLPYFPVVLNRPAGSISLFTLNGWHHPIHASVVSRYRFCVEGDGLDDFPLGEPLMTWSMDDCTHPDFQDWAYSILKPAIAIEASNQRYGPMWRFVRLHGGPYEFATRANGQPLPSAGRVLEIAPGNGVLVLETLGNIMGPFINHISNVEFANDVSGHILGLRQNFRALGFDPDPSNSWDQIAADMKDYIERNIGENLPRSESDSIID